MFTDRTLVIGESGSGKTVLAATYAKKLIKHKDHRRRPRHTVIVSKDPREQSALAPLCQTHAEVSQRTSQMTLDLKTAIKEAGSIYFELTAHDPRYFLQQLGAAVLAIGGILCIFDEAQSYLKSDAPTEILDVYSRGRKFGLHVITITPSIKQRNNYGLHRTITNEYTKFIAFRKTEPLEQKLITEHIPGASAELLANLKGPNDGKPEYIVMDKLSGRTSVQLRSGTQAIKEASHGTT